MTGVLSAIGPVPSDKDEGENYDSGKKPAKNSVENKTNTHNREAVQLVAPIVATELRETTSGQFHLSTIITNRHVFIEQRNITRSKAHRSGEVFMSQSPYNSRIPN